MLSESELLSHFDGARRSGSGWMARCPHHHDAKASLSISQGTERWLLHCHAGCLFSDVMAAAGLSMNDVGAEGPPTSPAALTEYQYRDESGKLLYQVVRTVPKDFRQRRPDGVGGWIWSLSDVRRVVYRLPELKGRDTILICEGEKDVDAAWAKGIAATCNSGGAGKWTGAHTEQLVTAGVHRVYIVPDDDEPGRRHADTVAQSCKTAGLVVKVVPVPAKDLAAFFESGGDVDDLRARIGAAPVYVSPAVPALISGPSQPPIGVEHAVIVNVSTVKREEVAWLWDGRLARGKLHILAGEPGEGKSTMLLDAAARCSRGANWPDGGQAPEGPVLLLSAEDGLADTIAPRLDAAGAYDTRIHVLTAISTSTGGTRGLNLARDLAQLEAAIRQVRPVLVVIDPISAYMPKVDTWRDSDVRSVLAPLAALAETVNCAVVAVMHLTKNAGAKVLHRVLGSIGFVGAARVVLAVAQHPDDADRRLLLSVKNNLAQAAPTLCFHRDGQRIVWDDTDVRNLTADAVFQASVADPTERRDAEDFLREMLAVDEPILAYDMFKAARRIGISDSSLKRAKTRLKVRSRKIGFGPHSRWYWSLPPAEGRQHPISLTNRVVPFDPLREKQRVSKDVVTPNDLLSPEPSEADEGSKGRTDFHAPNDGVGEVGRSDADEPTWVADDSPLDLSDPIGARDEPDEP